MLRRACEQNSDAWRDLVALYGPLIAFWCRHCGLDSHLAADCTQDVFAAVAKSLHRFQPAGEKAAFRGWLWTITSNKIRDRMRVEARNAQACGGSTALRSIADIADPASVPDEDSTGEVQLNQLVARALQQIRPEFADKTWQMFERSVIDGILTAQVAEQFAVSPAMVRQSRSRILRRLRDHLGDVD